MTTTLATLRTRVEEITSRSEIANSDMELFFINSAIRLIQRKDIFRIGGSTTTLTSVAVTSGDVGNLAFSTSASGLIASGFPSTFRAYRDLVQTSPSNKSGFAIMTWEYANRVWRTADTLSSSNSDIFQGVTVEGSTIYLQPRFTATSSFAAGNWVFTLYYDAWLADLSATTDSNYITDNAPELVAYLASSFVMTYLRENDDANAMLGIANTLISEFSRSEFQSTNAGKFIKLGDLQEIAMSINAKQLGG